MSTALRDAADATMQTITDLVDDARQHIDIPRSRKKSHNSSLWGVLLVVAFAMAAAIVVRQRKSRASADTTTAPTEEPVAA